MLDRVHAGRDRRADPLDAVRVRGDTTAEAVRGAHDRLELVRRQLRRARTLVTGREDRTGRHELDDVRARGHLFADRLGDVPDAVRLAVHPAPRRRAGRRHRHDLPGQDQTRSAHEAALDGATKTELEVVAPAHVAHCREACLQRAPSVLGHAQHPQRWGIGVLDGRVGEAGVGEMHVAVDQAGKDRRAAKLDALGVGRVEIGPDAHDPVRFDEYGSRRQQSSAVEEAVGRDEDPARGHAP